MPTSSRRPYRIAIFASGGGSNAEQIIRYFADHEQIAVNLIVSNKQKAGVLNRAKNYGIPALVIRKSQLKSGEELLGALERYGITHVVLAGFLLLIPAYLIAAYKDKILNIHPSLLPKYGGKGMYGEHVHKAVKANQEPFSGMTIHLVNQEYDKGEILFQKTVDLNKNDTSEAIARKVLSLEHSYYSKVIEGFITKDLNI